MARYYEVYAFQGSNWSLIQAFEGDRTELEQLVSEIFVRMRVMGVRVVAEEEARNGETRMRVMIRRDKRDGLPPFVLSADGKPLYGGKPQTPDPYEVSRQARDAALASAAAKRPQPVKEPSIFDIGDWVKAGLIVIGAAVGMLIVDRIRNVPAEYSGLLEAIRLALLAVMILAMARPLIRTWRNGNLFVSIVGPSRPAKPRAAVPAPAAASATAGSTLDLPEDPDVLVRQAIALIDEGFRRVRDGLDDFGWLGFRLFIGGVARAMAPNGPEERQREFMLILLERIGDAPEKAELFVARGAAMFENERNARMADAGTFAWDENDADAFERAIAWWNAPDSVAAAPAPTSRTALVCLIARTVTPDRKAELRRRIGQLASVSGASDRGDANAHTLLFQDALVGVTSGAELLRHGGDGALRIGIATDADAVEAAIRARSLADAAPRDGALVDAGTRDRVSDPALWGPPNEDGVSPLLATAAPETADRASA